MYNLMYGNAIVQLHTYTHNLLQIITQLLFPCGMEIHSPVLLVLEYE